MDLSNENVIHVKKENIEYLQFRRLLEYNDDISHAFTLGINNDFRMPLYSKQTHLLSEKQIEENKNSYRILCKNLGIEYKDIVKTCQVHKDTIKNVKRKINLDKPDFLEKCYAETDGLMTNKRHIAICATNADCIVLMLYDKNKRVIANIHSGWRGTIQKIAAKGIDKMQELYNCNPKDIICCISPSIRKCHFEVGEDVKNMYESVFPKYKKEIEQIQEKWHIDTVKINIDMLREKGLQAENIIDSKICTVCNSNSIHSYRGAHKQNGLEIGIIELK